MTLQELREWHWKEVGYCRKSADNLRERNLPQMGEVIDKLANFHIKAVQCLNDYVPGTAENDIDEREQAIAAATSDRKKGC